MQCFFTHIKDDNNHIAELIMLVKCGNRINRLRMGIVVTNFLLIYLFKLGKDELSQHDQNELQYYRI